MSDLFHEGVPDEFIIEVVRVMEAADWHIYQVLTKRSERMGDLLGTKLRSAGEARHIWWGVSVENRKHGLPRIRDLQRAPAGMRFLSIEPLIEDMGDLPLRGIDWVIVSGESGAGARPMRAEWVRSIRDQCERAGAPFFFKQWGGVRKNAAGRTLDGRTHMEVPVVPTRDVPPPAVRRAALASCG